MSDLNLELERLGIISLARLEEYYPRVRDRKDISVLRDPSTEVIVLSSCAHVTETYYENRKETELISVHDSVIASPRLKDNIRRAEEFGGQIRGKRWLDFGCGLGGMLDELATEASWAAGLEPNQDRASIVSAKGHHVVTSLDDLEDASVDIVTMFHVLEHLTEPVAPLKSLQRVLSATGVLLIEVPHARDALFSLYECDAFKRFTFWSEHLVLHTRQSLHLLLTAAGYPNPKIMSYQRYPPANHLYWLSHGTPGGHDIWSMLNDKHLEHAYFSTLSKLDITDTLVLQTT